MNSRQTTGTRRRSGPAVAGPWGLGVAVWLLALLLPCHGLEFQAGTVVNLRQFKTQGHAEEGGRWYLDGQSAVIRGAVYELTGVVVRFEDSNGKTAVVRSQACTYYQDSGLVESNAAVRVESGDITLDGVGFDMLMAERRLRIRDAVRMEVPAARANLGALSPTSRPVTPPAKTAEQAKPTP